MLIDIIGNAGAGRGKDNAAKGNANAKASNGAKTKRIITRSRLARYVVVDEE